MPKIHCKHCKHVSSSIGEHGKHMGKSHRAVLVAQLKRARGKRAKSGKSSSRNATSSDRTSIGKRLSVPQLYALLAMIKALIAMQEGHHRSKRKGKRKK